MGQVFGITTLDALFKWVLGEDSSSEVIRASFFHAFAPHLNIRSSIRIDDHMQPLKELQNLRHMVNNKDTTDLVNFLKEQNTTLKVHVQESSHDRATEFLKSLLEYFDDIQYAFPEPRFDGTMDFVCELDTGEKAIIEMQIIPESYWDQRALAYVAAIYGNQLRRKDRWQDIRKIVGINILGGGLKDERHWPDTPNQYMRHYKIQEQLHGEHPPRFIEGIEILQYSLANAPKGLDSQEKQDWLCFFRHAHRMSEEDVQREIKTPAVLEAFARAKLCSLPEQIKKNYDKEESRYVNCSEYIEKEKAEGEAKGKAEGKAEGLAEGKAEERVKAEQEKAEIQAKAEQEKAEIQAKAEQEKAEIQAKAETEKTLAIKNIARDLRRQGLPVSTICHITKLSEKEIEDL